MRRAWKSRARTRPLGGRARILLAGGLLAILSACGRGGRDAEGTLPIYSDSLRTADALEARLVLERFLSDLPARRFAEAEEDYSGDLRRLRDLSPQVAPDDVAELLERYCTHHGGVCLPSRLVGGRVLGPGLYAFVVEFLGEDGTPIAIGDPLLPQERTTRFPIRVQRIGTRYYVLDLPPRRE